MRKLRQGLAGGSWKDSGRIVGMLFAIAHVAPGTKQEDAGIRCAKTLGAGEVVPTDMIEFESAQPVRTGPPAIPFIEALRVIRSVANRNEVLAKVLGSSLR